jgi:hypothetical protein
VIVDVYNTGNQSNYNNDKANTPFTVSVQEIIVDDLSSGFVKYGPSEYWHDCGTGGYNNHFYYTRNSDTAHGSFNYATWTPNLPSAGTYGVYVYVPNSSYASTTFAYYGVVHNGTTEYRSINQNSTSGWVYLGDFYFNASGSEYIFLTDVTLASINTEWVAFDAIKWVKR